MKRKYAFVCVFVLLIALTASACASKKEVEALEARVTYLENLLGISNTAPSDTMAAQENGTSGGNNASDEKGVYPLGGMNADEVVNLCMEILDNVPTRDKTLDEYEASIPVANSIRDKKNKISLGYRFEKDKYKGINGIFFTNVNGLNSEMDGTISYENGTNVEISVYIHLTDYNCAEYVFDKLCDTISDYYDAEENALHIRKENKEGSYWTFTLYDTAMGKLQIATLQRIDDEFELMCCKQYILD